MILQFCSTSGGFGGIPRYVEFILNSPLARKHKFEEVTTWWGPGLHPAAVLQSFRLLRRKKPDLLHLHGLGPAAFHMAVAAQIARQPTLLTIHAFTEDNNSRGYCNRNFIGRVLEPLTIRAATAAYCVSQYGNRKSVYQRNVSVDLGHINNFAPTWDLPANNLALRAEFGFSHNDTVALCITRIEKEKGIFDLISAFRLPRIERPNRLKLLLVGGGSELEKCRLASGPLISSGEIVMPGRRSDIHELLGIADFVILPSIIAENQSLAVLEAMAAGKAVVATNTGGTPELVLHRDTGILCPPLEPEALRSAMIELCKNPEWRARLGAAGRVRAQQVFSPENFCNRLDEIYTKMRALGRVTAEKSEK